MLSWLGGLMDRIFAVIGAIIFAQAPLFMQQYTQQLIGREAELKLQVDALRKAALLSHKTLEQLIQKFIDNSDMDFVRQGEGMLAMVGRWHHISDALNAMQESTIWSRPMVFMYHISSDAFYSTAKNFKIGLPFSLEGGIYALAGIALGYLVFSFLRKILQKLGGIFKKASKKSISAY